MGNAPPIFFEAGTPAWVSLPSIAGQVYATNVPQARLLNAATVQKKNALVPKSCLAAGSGKNGGFSKKAPDIRCLVSALGAGPGLRKPKVFSPRRNAGTYRGAGRTGSAPLFAAAPWVVDDSELENHQPSISGDEVQNRGKRRSAACGGASKPLSRNPPKRCQWQKKRLRPKARFGAQPLAERHLARRCGFEDGPRSAGALHLPIGWPDGEQKRHDWRPRQGPGIVLPQRWARIEIPLQCLSLTGRGRFSL